MVYQRRPYAGKSKTQEEHTIAEDSQDEHPDHDDKPKKYWGKSKGSSGGKKSPFTNLTKLFPSKKGGSYTVFLNDQTRSKILNFVEKSGDTDLLGVSIGEDGECRMWGIFNKEGR